jgi:hypothetical protein
MAPTVGYDSSKPITQDLINDAKSVAPPSFWGRYFHSPGRRNYRGKLDSVNYGRSENTVLNENRIPILLIARQTPCVGGSSSLAANHATRNVSAIFEAIPPSHFRDLCPKPLVFLDIEPDVDLSVEYYTAWAHILTAESLHQSDQKVELLPAVYLNSARNGRSVESLNKAVSQGGFCAGIWTARYVLGGCGDLPPWRDQLAKPRVDTDLPILCWQCLSTDANDCPGFDTTIINEPCVEQLLRGLVVPPAAEPISARGQPEVM